MPQFSVVDEEKETERVIHGVPRRSILVVPPPPSYDSIVKTDLVTDSNKLSHQRYILNPARKLSNGTLSDSDSIQSNSVCL